MTVLLLLVSAALLALPFHFGVFGFLAFLAFIPYFFSLEGKSSSAAFRDSYLFGLFFFLFVIYPLAYVSVFALIAVVMYLALYFGFFGLLASPFLSASAETREMVYRDNLKSVFYVPAFWVLLEFLRGWVFTGLPLAFLGYSQWENLAFIQIADIAGVYGVSFSILFINVVLYRILRAFSRRTAGVGQVFGSGMSHGRYLLYLFCLLVAAGGCIGAYGLWVLNDAAAFHAKPAGKPTLRVSVLQGNVPQDQKWDARIKGIIFEKYKRLTFMSALEKPDLIVWPETSFPGYLEDEPVMSTKLRSMIRHSATPTLVGAPTFGDIERGLRFYNSAVLFGADGEEQRRYSKVHLVPFGEYLPLEPFLSFTRVFGPIAHFSAGKELALFSVKMRVPPKQALKFAALICYEDMFPNLVRSFCKGGADFLVNITNDAWFGPTSAPTQHAQASIFRAVENRVPVVRAGNAGLSCFISPEGKILSRVRDKGKDIFVTGHKTQDILFRKRLTFYTRFGDVFLIFAAALCMLAWRDRARQNRYARL